MANNALLDLVGLTKRFRGDIIGVDNVNLSVGEGEFVSLLGPSGCGKTTTLRLVAGFEDPSEGRIELDGVDITPLQAFDRPVNTVFQDYALFPHMTVAENVGFGLSLRKIRGKPQRKIVMEALELVGLADKIDAKTQALSGGQRQRVALARAIVCQPRILLLDEPLSALDAHLREQMQIELKRLQRELGTTFVMVTHDQTEALSISDRIVVMNRGVVEQAAPPDELYDRPASRFVASFIGTMNLLPARCIGGDDTHMKFTVGDLVLSAPVSGKAHPHQGDMVDMGVRPEDVLLGMEELEGSAPATVESVVFHGRNLRINLLIDNLHRLTADVPRQSETASLTVGQTVRAYPRPGALCPVYTR